MIDINKDTDLSELMPSDDAADLIMGVDKLVQQKCSDRSGVIEAEKSRGLSPEVKVAETGQPLFNAKASLVAGEYNTASALSSALYTLLTKAARNQELKEVNILITCLTDEITRLEGEIETAETEYSNNTGLIDAKKVDSTNPFLNLPTGEGYTICNSTDKTNAKNDQYEKYKGTSGIITNYSREKKKYEDRKTLAEQRKTELERVLSTYSRVGDTEEYDDRGFKKGTGAESKDPTKVYDSDGNEKDTKQNTTPSNYKKGDQVVIDGEKYTSYGYVKDKDGNYIGLYSKNNKLYTVDKNGKAVEAKSNVDTKAGTNTYTINGEEYNNTDIKKEDAPGKTLNEEFISPSKVTVDAEKATDTTTTKPETKDTTNTANATDATTTDKNNSTDTTKTTPNTELYDVYHTTDENGNNIELYRESSWDSQGNIKHTYYYMKDGQLVEAKAKTVRGFAGIDKTVYEIDGVDYEADTITKGNTTNTPATTYIDTSSETLSYNGKTYDKTKYTVTTATGTYDIYHSGWSNSGYYMDANGTVHEAKSYDSTNYFPIEDAEKITTSGE